MKKTLAFVLALCMVFALCACGGNAPAKEEPTSEPAAGAAAPAGDSSDELKPITIVFATPNANANIESEYAQKWIAAVEEKSGGKITFDYTDSGALGNYEELLEGTVNGVYDMTITEPSYIATYVPESNLLSLPMLYSSYEEVDWILDGEVGQWYNEKCRAAGIEVLNYFYCGFRYIISEKEITSLDTAKNVIIRSPNIQTYLDTLQMLGFKCETMAFSEAYTAMETGVISAVECPLQNLYSTGYYQLCPYLLGSRHMFSANSIVANETFWAGLAPEYKEIMTNALSEITKEERTECAAREDQFLADFAEKGTAFNEFDDASKTAINEMFASYWTDKVATLGEEAVSMLNIIIEHKG
ncbi:MAG: TRAP transporter substrate-binding protein [Firmicutes bacterium]|nr:TRAP transporter substrate-binding protein [Bacillota bacterium]